MFEKLSFQISQTFFIKWLFIQYWYFALFFCPFFVWTVKNNCVAWYYSRIDVATCFFFSSSTLLHGVHTVVRVLRWVIATQLLGVDTTDDFKSTLLVANTPGGNEACDTFVKSVSPILSNPKWLPLVYLQFLAKLYHQLMYSILYWIPPSLRSMSNLSRQVFDSLLNKSSNYLYILECLVLVLGLSHDHLLFVDKWNDLPSSEVKVKTSPMYVPSHFTPCNIFLLTHFLEHHLLLHFKYVHVPDLFYKNQYIICWIQSFLSCFF